MLQYLAHQIPYYVPNNWYGGSTPYLPGICLSCYHSVRPVHILMHPTVVVIQFGTDKDGIRQYGPFCRLLDPQRPCKFFPSSFLTFFPRVGTYHVEFDHILPVFVPQQGKLEEPQRSSDKRVSYHVDLNVQLGCLTFDLVQARPLVLSYLFVFVLVWQTRVRVTWVCHATRAPHLCASRFSAGFCPNQSEVRVLR